MSEQQQLLDRKQASKLYWCALLFHFALFSFNSLATCLIAALVGVKWDALTGQEKFMITVAIVANWTGLIITFVRQALNRLAAGKPPIETGDTQHLKKSTP